MGGAEEPDVVLLPPPPGKMSVERCREATSPSIPELRAALSAMDLRLLSGSWALMASLD